MEFFVDYWGDTNLRLMERLFCRGGSTSVSTTSTLEAAWKSRSLQELIILSDSHASVSDDTEVVPPKSKKHIQRSQHISMPSPLIDDEAKMELPIFLSSICYRRLLHWYF